MSLSIQFMKNSLFKESEVGEDTPLLVYDTPGQKRKRAFSKCWAIFCSFFVCFAIPSIMTLAVVLLIIFHILFPTPQSHKIVCLTQCEFFVVENFATEMNLALIGDSMYTHEAMIEIFESTQDHVKVLEWEVLLTNDAGKGTGGEYGNLVMRTIESSINNGTTVSFVVNKPERKEQQRDIDYLESVGAEVYEVDPENVLPGGIFHSKIIIGDTAILIGSSNLSWKSLSQNKELNLYFRNCTCLAQELTRIYDLYKYLVTKKIILDEDKIEYMNDNGFEVLSYIETFINSEEKLEVPLREYPSEPAELYFSSSPPFLTTPNRDTTLSSVLNVIHNAEVKLFVSIMEYFTVSVFESERRVFTAIDEALKDAVLRNVSVKILVSKWNYTFGGMMQILNGLQEYGKFCDYTGQDNEKWCYGDIEIRIFEIPDPKKIRPYPYTRVNNAKFVVSDKEIWTSSSNWIDDYFFRISGVDVVVRQEKIRSQLEDIFLRDWRSSYTTNLTDCILE